MIFQKKHFNKNRTEILNDQSSFAFVESFKSLRTNLGFATFNGEVKTIVVTSSIPDEGKSSVSINLALVLSKADKKVLLIDGDLRKPSLQRYLRIRKKVVEGFSTVLSGTCSVEDAIYMYADTNLSIMLSGPIPPNASELYTRDTVGTVLNELKEKFDYIIIDTSPLAVVSDASLLARHVDGAIMVVRQKFVDKNITKKTLNQLKKSGVNVLGTVLNAYKSQSSRKNDVYDYYSYYGENQ